MNWRAERLSYPRAMPKSDATLGHVIEQGDVFGDADGMPVGEDNATLADADALGVGGEVGADEDGVGHGSVPAVPGEVVLGEPHGGEPGLVEDTGDFPELIGEFVPGVHLAEVVVDGAVKPHG